MMKEKKPSVMHVGIEEPNEKRKEILDSAINTIELLKSYERLKKLKREREIAKKEIKTIAKEIKYLFSETEELMPHVELTKEPPKRVEAPPRPPVIREKPKEKAAVSKPRPPEVKIDPHTEKLERDLQELRDKISRI
jgi:hypothetical protein